MKHDTFKFHRHPGFFFALWCLFVGAGYAWTLPFATDLSSPPGIDRDDVFYDNIAYNLSMGRGFRLDFQDPEWRKVYREHNQSGSYDWVLAIQAKGLTASRAPAFPALLSVSYRVLGRTWLIPRLLNIAILALGLAIVVFGAGHCMDMPLVPVIAALTLTVDFGVMMFAAKLMTEPLAILSTSFAFVLVLVAQQSDRKEAWFTAGLGLGLGILVRPNLNAWMLMLVVLAGLAVLLGRGFAENRVKFITKFGWFLLGVVIVSSPWWVRNCRVANSFEPFGTAGKIGWVGGYCDQALQNNGNWNLEAVRRQQRKSAVENDYSQMELAEKEHWIGADSQSAGFRWMKSNWTQMPRLMFSKAMTHLGFTNENPLAIWIVNVLLVLSASVGMGLSWQRFGRWATLVLFLSLATTMLTWAHHGRYSIPVRPLIHLGSAVSGAFLLSWVWGRVSSLKKSR